MKKKFLGVVLSVAMVASLLAGCGDSKKAEPADNNTQKEDTADADADNSYVLVDNAFIAANPPTALGVIVLSAPPVRTTSCNPSLIIL